MNIETLVLRKPNILNQNSINVLNKIYFSYIKNIKWIISNNKFVRDSGYELFETEWKYYSDDVNNILNQMISKPYLLMRFKKENNLDGNISK